MNVVVVSDEPVLAALARRPLEPLGHAVTAVASVARARARGSPSSRRDAALLPRRLPDRSLARHGRDAARRPRAPIAAIVVGVATARSQRRARRRRRRLPARAVHRRRRCSTSLGATTRAKKLILLADDSPLIHRHTVPILEDDGYEVRSAHDGEEAIALARALAPDLVITDVEMPKLDGYGVCKALKDDAADRPRAGADLLARSARPPISSAASTPAPTTTWSSR